HKRWVKPVLSDKQKRDRVGFALSHMHRKGGARVVVDDMYDCVHMDEKWFYVMKDGRGIYLHPEEDAPKPPRAQNKRFITRVMFLAAVARPRMISDGVRLTARSVSGPSRILRECVDHQVTRSSCSRTVQSRTRGGGVMEAIQAKSGDSIILETLPANSPDLNVKDLGFFHSIQQLKEDVGVSSPDDLVEATMEAFDVYPRETLERVWQSLFAVLGEVLGSKGDNSYKLPHLG
ncbi:unnamed protein product, partial [Discosporangium mesarthrocarpum]